MTFDDRETKYTIREKLKQEIKQKQGWYFITFDRELPAHRPYGFTLFNEPFVLLKDPNNDDLVCCSLASVTSQESKVEVRSFKVEARQGEIWFWRGKLES